MRRVGWMAGLVVLFLSLSVPAVAGALPEELLRRARQGDRAERVEAVGELAGMEARRDQAVPVLASLALEDSYHPVRGLAAAALGRIGGEAAVDALLEALVKESDKRPLWMVIEALGEAGDRRAVEPLLPFLENPEPGIRWVTAGSLGMLGDPRAESALRKAFLDRESSVREMAAWALERTRARD